MGSQRSAADLLAAYDEDFVGFAGSTSGPKLGPDVTGGAADDSLDPDGLFAHYDDMLRAFADAHPELGERLGAIVLATDFDESDAGDDCGACTGSTEHEEKYFGSAGYMDEAAEEDTFSSTAVPLAEEPESNSAGASADPPVESLFRFVVDA